MNDRPSLHRRTVLVLALIVGIALGLRIGLALVHPYWFPDSADYDELARRMLEGRSYEAGGNFASRMPGYPLLVAGIYALCGYSTKVVLAAHAVMGAAVAWLSYLIARRAGEGVGVAAAALAAFDPLSIGFSASFLTEIPFTLCLMLGLLLAIRLAEGCRRPWLHWLALGIVWGVGVYLRASALWAIVPLVLVAAWNVRHSIRDKQVSLRASLAGAAVAVLLVFVLLTPWLVRNYSHFHSGFFRLTTLEGISLYEAVYPPADGGPRQDKISLPPEMQGLDEARRNDEWARRGWGYVFHEPGRILMLGIRKMGRTWSPWFNPEGVRDSGAGSAIQAIMTAWYLPLFALAVVGFFSRIHPLGGPIKLILIIPLVYFTGVHSLFLGSVRYRVPLMPIVCIFAAQGVLTLYSIIWGRRAKQSGANRV